MIVENLEYWARFKINPTGGFETNPHEIVEFAAEILNVNFGVEREAAKAMLIACGRAAGEAGLVVDPYTNAYYQYCLMVSEQAPGERK